MSHHGGVFHVKVEVRQRLCIPFLQEPTRSAVIESMLLKYWSSRQEAKMTVMDAAKAEEERQRNMQEDDG